MSHLLYAYIAAPEPGQVESFLCALKDRGVSISHLGKTDPARNFSGSISEAVTVVFRGTDLTNSTFARDAARHLDFGFEIHNDPRWTHSTLSASCADPDAIAIIAESAFKAFVSFLTIRGVSGGGKDQPWEVVYITERCPNELRSRFVAG